MLNKYKKFGILIGILLITLGYFKIIKDTTNDVYAQTPGSYIVSPVPTTSQPPSAIQNAGYIPTITPSTGSELLRSCPAIFDSVAPIICIDDGQGHCLH